MRVLLKICGFAVQEQRRSGFVGTNDLDVRRGVEITSQVNIVLLHFDSSHQIASFDNRRCEEARGVCEVA